MRSVLSGVLQRRSGRVLVVRRARLPASSPSGSSPLHGRRLAVGETAPAADSVISHIRLSASVGGVGGQTTRRVNKRVVYRVLKQQRVGASAILCPSPASPWLGEPGLHSDNGLIFQSFKEECIWQRTFRMFAEVRRSIRDWEYWYNHGRPRTVHWVTRAPSSFKRNNQPKWCDFGRASHDFVDGNATFCHSDTNTEKIHGYKERDRTKGCACWTWVCGASYRRCLRQAG